MRKVSLCTLFWKTECFNISPFSLQLNLKWYIVLLFHSQYCFHKHLNLIKWSFTIYYMHEIQITVIFDNIGHVKPILSAIICYQKYSFSSLREIPYRILRREKYSTAHATLPFNLKIWEQCTLFSLVKSKALSYSSFSSISSNTHSYL